MNPRAVVSLDGRELERMYGALAFPLPPVQHPRWSMAYDCASRLFDPSGLDELSFVGGVPDDELEWEDGLEAPLRHRIRSVDEWETSELAFTQQDPWELEDESVDRRSVEREYQTLRQQRRAQEARDRRVALEQIDRDIREYRSRVYRRRAMRANARVS